MLLRLAFLAFRLYLFVFRPVRIGVRVVVLQERQVLLIRQTYVAGWFLPGGGVKRGETLEQAARREAREEVGAELGELQMLGAYTNFTEWKSDHNVVFLARAATLGGRPDGEVAEARFFSLEQLPEGLWPGHRLRLDELRQGLPHPTFGEW